MSHEEHCKECSGHLVATEMRRKLCLQFVQKQFGPEECRHGVSGAAVAIYSTCSMQHNTYIPAADFCSHTNTFDIKYCCFNLISMFVKRIVYAACTLTADDCIAAYFYTGLGKVIHHLNIFFIILFQQNCTKIFLHNPEIVCIEWPKVIWSYLQQFVNANCSCELAPFLKTCKTQKMLLLNL